MSDLISQIPSIQPGCYEIRIREPIGETWQAWFDEFTITRTESGETLLTGPIADQSALHGLLAKIRDLNLTLLTVNLTQSEPLPQNGLPKMNTIQTKHVGCLSRILRALFWIVLVLALLLAGGCTYQRIALAQTREQFPAPGKLVDVNGHLMHIHCIGSGLPTVVIDAGNGSFSAEWSPIQEEVSQTTRVCTYDRAGYGWSEAGPQPRDGMQVVSELHDLLQAADELGPYVLVGHSLGGVHVRLFAAQYPAEVAGLILIDTAHPLTITPEFEMQMQGSIGFYQAMNLMTSTGLLRILGPLGGEDSMPATAHKLPPELQEIYLNLLLDPSQYTTAIAEMQNLPQTFEQTSQLLKGNQPFGDLPLIVITAGQTSASGSTPFNEQYVSVPESQIQNQFMLAMQSSRGEQRVIEGSSHSVHLDAPEDVVKAIRDMLEMIAGSE